MWVCVCGGQLDHVPKRVQLSSLQGVSSEMDREFISVTCSEDKQGYSDSASPWKPCPRSCPCPQVAVHLHGNPEFPWSNNFGYVIYLVF